eukprot:1265029-Amorphochlora_amoeboformis.AAC.1
MIFLPGAEGEATRSLLLSLGQPDGVFKSAHMLWRRTAGSSRRMRRWESILKHFARSTASVGHSRPFIPPIPVDPPRSPPNPCQCLLAQPIPRLLVTPMNHPRHMVQELGSERDLKREGWAQGRTEIGLSLGKYGRVPRRGAPRGVGETEERP